MEQAGARILVVDDEADLEEIIRWKFRLHIRDLHWRFDFARDGRQALETAEAGEPYDVVVTDIRMPVMDGLELLRKLRTRDPDAVVVVVSAYGDIPSIRRAMNEGAFDFVTKPIDLRDLELTLVRALVTVRKAREARKVAILRLEAEAASQAKSRFLAAMSHELRTPLNAVVLYCELVLQDVEGVVPPQVVSDLGRILAASRHLRTLVRDILEVCTMEAHHATLALEEFVVRDVVSEVAGVLEKDVTRRGNCFRWSVADEVDRMTADPTRLRQALYNVLSNAAKFTHEGSVSLDVVQCASAEGDDFVEFRVTDTGPGIESEDLERLLQPFAQGANARKHEGSGLGLSITRLVCEAMGGSLLVDSTPGQGSTFTMRIPREVERREEACTP